MKKLLIRGALVLVVLVVALFLGAGLLLEPASQAAVEHGTAYALGVESRLGGVDAGVGLGESHFGLNELTVHNPAGIEGGPFLQIGEISVSVKTLTVLSQTIELGTLVLDGLHLRLVQDGARSNFKEIYGRVQELAGGAEQPTTTPAPAEDSPEDAVPSEDDGPGILIGTVSLTGIQLSAEVHNVPGVEFHETYTVPDLNIDVAQAVAEVSRRTAAAGSALDAAQGLTVAQLTSLIIDQLIRHGLESSDGKIPPQALQLLQGDLEGLGRQLETQATEALQKARDKVMAGDKEGLEDLIQEEKGKLKDLFGGGDDR